MGRGSNAVRQIRQKGIRGLAWSSLIVALVGGTLAAAMEIGVAIRKILDAQPWAWLPAVLVLVGVITVGIDLLIDGIPNQAAIAGALLVPSIAAAAPGRLSRTVGEWSDGLVGWLHGGLVDWLGTNSATGLTVACVVGAVLMARRVVKKSSAGHGAYREA